jgi:hypothetical protein
MSPHKIDPDVNYKRLHLYCFRTSIVHKLGVATSDVAKCRVFKWFKLAMHWPSAPIRCGAEA